MGLALALVTLAPALSAHDQSKPEQAFDEAEALRYSQAAVGRRVGDHAFRNTSLRPVRLSDYRGRPLVISLIYTSCAHTCPVVIQTLADVVEVAREALGEDSFAVVTVGFDWRHDTPDRMRAYQKAQGIRYKDWAFLSADHDTIDALTRDLGFLYWPSPGGFEHLVQTTVLDGDGTVLRQIYGTDFDPPALVEPLKALLMGRAGELGTVTGLLERVRLFCTIYNPSSDRYRFDYSLFIMLATGFLCLSALAFIIVRAWLRTRHAGNRRAGATQ